MNPTNINSPEEQFKLRSRRILGEPEVPFLIRFLVKKGIVKNENGAVIILLILVAIIVILTIFLFKTGGPQPATIDPNLFK